MFIEELLGNATKIKILRTLIEKNSARSLYDLISDTGLSIGIIHRELLKLKKADIIFVPLKERKQEFYRINQNNRYYRVLKALFSEEKEVDRADKVYLTVWNTAEILVRKLVKKFSEIEKIFLFGSMAAGSARYDSDIDVLIVAGKFKEQKAILEEVREINKKIKNKINISFSTKDEFEKSSPLINEIKKGGIRLW